MAITHRPSPLLGEQRGWGIADPSGVRRRAWSCLAALCLIFSGLLARLWYLQVVQGSEFLAQAQRNRLRHVTLPAPRGLILDRHGETLARSRALHSVALVPAALPSLRRAPEERRRLLTTLGALLGLAPDDIEERVQEARDNGRQFDAVPVAQDVDLQTITQIEENKWRLGPAVLVTDDIARLYPNGQLAAHVLGYAGGVNAQDLAANLKAREADPQARALHFDDVIGKSGIEREYDRYLSGRAGSDDYEVDAKLRPVRRRGTTKEKPGSTVVLTLDAKLQRAAEDALNAARNSGAAIAVDPRSGEILALASRPGFDPNLFSLPRQKFSKAWQQLARDPKNPLINRAVSSRFPPGSTFKMVTASAALQQGTLTPGTVYNCAGGLRMGRFFGCWKTHGNEDLMGALAQSCDVYFYQAALRLGDPESSGPTYLAKIARQFGLGRKTGIDLPIDEKGLIPDPAWRREVNAASPDLARWYPGNTLNMSIGQGDVLATPLQMALVASVVANGGTLWQPHLLKSVQDENGKTIKTFTPQGQSVGVDAKNLALVREGMRRVVASGTGRSVALPNLEIAGKTGSAEDAHHALPHAWFVCFAPVQNPQIAIAVMIENAGHGAENAAPIAKKILQAEFPETVKTGVVVARH